VHALRRVQAGLEGVPMIYLQAYVLLRTCPGLFDGGTGAAEALTASGPAAASANAAHAFPWLVCTSLAVSAMSVSSVLAAFNERQAFGDELSGAAPSGVGYGGLGGGAEPSGADVEAGGGVLTQYLQSLTGPGFDLTAAEERAAVRAYAFVALFNRALGMCLFACAFRANVVACAAGGTVAVVTALRVRMSGEGLGAAVSGALFNALAPVLGRDVPVAVFVRDVWLLAASATAGGIALRVQSPWHDRLADGVLGTLPVIITGAVLLKLGLLYRIYSPLLGGDLAMF